MKKTLIAVAAAAAFATSAFAEVTFGAWGRQIWAPVASDGDKTYTYLNTSWGWNPRMGYGMDFTSENVDMHADFALENKYQVLKDDGSAHDYKYALAINDQLKVNVRPVEGVQLSIGKIQDDTLRGDACFGSWNWIRPNWIGDEGITFSRTVDVDMGVAAKITAVDNLVVLAALPVSSEGGRAEAKNAYKAVKIGAGYTIDGIGQIKAQFLGNGAEGLAVKDGKKATNTGAIEAAFKLTAVENLSAEVGFKMNIMDADYMISAVPADWSKFDPMSATKNTKTIALGARYQINDACAVAANAEVTLYPDVEIVGTKVSIDPMMKFGAGVDYALDNGIGLAADVRVNMPQNDSDPSIGFFAGASKGFSNGKLSVGFQGVNVGKDSDNGMCGNLKPMKDGKAAADGLVWAIPVCFEYWF